MHALHCISSSERAAPPRLALAFLLMTSLGCIASTGAGADSSGDLCDTDGACEPEPALDLVPVEFCVNKDDPTRGISWDAEPSFSTTADDALEWKKYECLESCAAPAACAYVPVAGNGIPADLEALDFVVGGQGGRLIYTPYGGDTVVLHRGNGGNAPPGGIFAELVAQSAATGADLRVAHIQWAQGNNALPSGWMSRSSPAPATVEELNERVASVLLWVHDNLVNGNRFGTAACSMGTVATFGASAWHGLSQVLDYQMLVGGPALWDLNVTCGGSPAYEEGYLTDDLAAWDTSSPCDASIPECLVPGPILQFQKWVDSMYQPGQFGTGDCTNSIYRDDFQTGFKYISLPTRYRLDMISAGLGDGRSGAGDALYLYASLADPTWTTFGYVQGDHCDAYNLATHIPATAAKIIRGLRGQ